MSEEKTVDSFEDFDEVEVEDETDATETKQKKVTLPLTEKDAVPGLYPQYRNYVENIQPLRMGLAPAKFDVIWNQMTESDKASINKMFKLKGKFGASGGVGKEEVAKSKAHQRAIDLKKEITQAMYGYAQEHFDAQLNELQKLNDKSVVSFEIYVKGWKKFVVGLPEDK